jgi:uncharacterized membrane protein (GlpM family)
VLVAFNPYFHLVATHFYTDALYFLLVILVLTRASSRGAWLPLTLLPLVRQFGLIFPLGVALQALRERRLRAVLVALMSLLPLCAFVALWHGFAPDTPRARIATSVHAVHGWFFPYVAAYHVAALGFYLAPVGWCVRRTRRFWLCGLVVLFGFAFLGGGLVAEALAVPSAPGFFVALFVLFSMFNFQAWDKYLLDVLPAALLAIFARPTRPPQ